VLSTALEATCAQSELSIYAELFAPQNSAVYKMVQVLSILPLLARVGRLMAGTRRCKTVPRGRQVAVLWMFR
jgi:hypothetical protein